MNLSFPSMNPGVANRIFLTGFMGCGKSTIAAPLSRILGLGLLDLDAEIELRAGESIPGIFSEKGERAFRELERTVLFETAARNSIVVALGGGTIGNEENFAFVKSAGVLVYLQVDFETLFGRLTTMARTADRPMLSPRDDSRPAGEDLRETMKRLLAEREPFYRRADLIVVPERDDPESSAGSIARRLGGFPGRALT